MNTSDKEPIFAEERKMKILELIKNNEKVTVSQLCSDFSVSSATIRNDLRELESSGLLKRTHGGAIANVKSAFELDAKHKEDQNMDLKEKIAVAALGLIDDGDTIILDTGTTTYELAKRLSEKRNLTVLTNDLEIARHLEEINDINIFFIGGIIRKKFHCSVGLSGIKMLSELVVDKAFMGTNAISLQKGATTPDINHAEIKKAMTSIANKVIVLGDSSKVGRNSFAQFATIDEIDIFITDSNIDAFAKEEFELNGLEVLIAED